MLLILFEIPVKVPVPLIFAEQAETLSNRHTHDIVWTSLWILLAIFLLAITAIVMKRRFNPDTGLDQNGFTLADIRKLYREGQLSEREYTSARSAILAVSGYPDPDGLMPAEDKTIDDDNFISPEEKRDSGAEDNSDNDSDKTDDDWL